MEISDDADETLQSYKYATANLYSKATFFWLTPLLWVGYTIPLELEDLGQLPKEERTEYQFKKFHDIYTREMVLCTSALQNTRMNIIRFTKKAHL